MFCVFLATLPKRKEADLREQLGNVLNTGDELSLLLEEEKMVGVPLLVLANKQDLQNALPADEVGLRIIFIMFLVLMASVMQFSVYSCIFKSTCSSRLPLG